jgi:coronin-1B/1C/6
MLEQQTKTIAAQSEKIGNLTAEVDSLKMRVSGSGGASQDQSERIRQLELELEAARS